MEPGFRIPIFSGIPESLDCFPDSKTKDSGLHSKNFPHSGIRIPLNGRTELRIQNTLFPSVIVEKGKCASTRENSTREERQHACAQKKGRCLQYLYFFE